ncbi:low-density lipoprotein receptor-like isoform X2 [Periplaneta americana]
MLPWQHSSSQSRKSLAARSHPVVICRGADGRPFDGFPCDEEACVPVSWVCDGDADCTGGADEKRCGACAEDELRCEVRGATTCLAPRFLCDGRRDCYDGSDESPDRCNSHCDFRCGDSGRCISHSQVCDLDDDCDDGSDESDCHQQPAHDECHREFEFLCHDSLGEEKWHHCVPRVWVCDGHDDCPHGEDEYTDACNRKKALGAE